jgi:formate dehydrogenase maturation protein FdhE
LKPSWDRRIKRAGELAKKHSEVAELLGFYQQLARFQQQIYEALPAAREHEVRVLLPYFSGLLNLVRDAGSPALKTAAAALAEDSEDDRLSLLESVWQHQIESQALSGEYPFFAQALLQPYAEYLADKSHSSSEGAVSILWVATGGGGAASGRRWRQAIAGLLSVLHRVDVPQTGLSELRGREQRPSSDFRSQRI